MPERNEKGQFLAGSGVTAIVASGNLAETDTFGLAIRGSGNATVQCESCQFRGIRIGQ